MSTKRYQGRICPKHPQERGERLASNRRCVRCHRERRGRWKLANIDTYRTSDAGKQKRWRQAHLDEARSGSAARAAMKRAKRKEAKALGLTRYYGKPCAKHLELRGERRNGHCVECERERQHTPDWREGHRRRRRKPDHLAWQHDYIRTPQYRARRRERLQTSEVWKETNRAGSAAYRARKLAAVSGDATQINRAFAALSRKAHRRGMVIDHVTPLRPCRVCGARGTHTPDNWAMLPPSLNASKGNRCMSCWMFDMGRPCVVWMPDPGASVMPNLMPSERRRLELTR